MTRTTDPLADALAALGLTALPDAATLERAYRAATEAHPAEQDAERVREAYELLQRPHEAGRRALRQTTPRVPPPRLQQDEPHPRGELSVLLLRASARHVSARALLAAPDDTP